MSYGSLLVLVLAHGVSTTQQGLGQETCGHATAADIQVNLLQMGSGSLSKSRSNQGTGDLTNGQQRPQDTNGAFSLPKPAEYLGYRESGGMECGLNHSEDLYKPIPKVMAEHPGVDGFCYFEFHAPWMAYLGFTQLENPNFLATAEASRLEMRSSELMCKNDLGMNKGPSMNITYLGDNGSIITLYDRHVDCGHISGDVKYCHALGWLGNQVDTALMTDPDAWRALNRQECQRLNDTYQFTNEEITVGKHIDDQDWIFNADGHARNLALHGYHKCLLGHGAEEMAYCAHLSCLLPGTSNQIGHGDACD